MAEKKQTSCSGFFLKSSLVSGLVLANLTVAYALLDVKFLKGNYQAWTDLSSPTSRPLMAVYGILGCSLALGFLLSIAFAAASAFISSGKDSKSSSSKPARPQSNRKTTI